MKPDIVVRAGNRFVIADKGLLPYLQKHKDLVISAVAQACKELKESPQQFSPSPTDKLSELNARVYELLTEWGVYKE